MTAVSPARSWPNGAALLVGIGRKIMDVTLHIGAHRSATTTFQHYMHDNQVQLARQGIAFWGPPETRNGLFTGLMRAHDALGAIKQRRRVGGRVKMRLEQLRQQGNTHLIVSEENMMGTMPDNLRHNALYPAVKERMARVFDAFGGQINRVVLTIRAQDIWWASACAYMVANGRRVPNAAKCANLVAGSRTWRQVITDVARAMPGVPILVTPFEKCRGRPDLLLNVAADGQATACKDTRWLNRSASAGQLRSLVAERGGNTNRFSRAAERWQPFDTEQCAKLREDYADDLLWLMAGADGLAELILDPERVTTGADLHPDQMTRGHDYGSRQGQVARSG